MSAVTNMHESYTLDESLLRCIALFNNQQKIVAFLAYTACYFSNQFAEDVIGQFYTLILVEVEDGNAIWCVH